MENNKHTRRAFLYQATNLIGTTVGLAAMYRGSAIAASSANYNLGEPAACDPGFDKRKPINFQPDKINKLRIRKNVGSLSQDEVARLRKAYAALKQLTVADPSDPRGWLRQANAHCWQCGGGKNGRTGEEIHNTWWFFPWHRAYIYFHERILAKLINDSDFTLPYWRWDTPLVTQQTDRFVTSTLVQQTTRKAGDRSNRQIPSIYSEPNDSSNSLFDSNRNFFVTDQIHEKIVGRIAMAKNLFLPSYQRFMGDGAGKSSSGGAIEKSPHDPIHICVGDRDGGEKIDMGLFSTAARDPLFFAHHANIDRLWHVWLNLVPGHKNPSDSAWLNHRWVFYDENRLPVSISVADILDIENSLHYSYEENDELAKTLFTGKEQPTEFTSKQVKLLGSVTANFSMKPEPASFMIPIPSMFRADIISLPRQTYSLYIEGIDIPYDKSAMIRVFANLPTADSDTALDFTHFLGNVTSAAKALSGTGHIHSPDGFSVVFDLSANIKELLRNDKNLTITLVPFDCAGKKPSVVNVKFRQISLWLGY